MAPLFYDDEAKAHRALAPPIRAGTHAGREVFYHESVAATGEVTSRAIFASAPDFEWLVREVKIVAHPSGWHYMSTGDTLGNVSDNLVSVEFFDDAHAALAAFSDTMAKFARSSASWRRKDPT